MEDDKAILDKARDLARSIPELAVIEAISDDNEDYSQVVIDILNLLVSRQSTPPSSSTNT